MRLVAAAAIAAILATPAFAQLYPSPVFKDVELQGVFTGDPTATFFWKGATSSLTTSKFPHVISSDTTTPAQVVGVGVLFDTFSAVVHNTAATNTVTGLNGVGVYGLNDSAQTGAGMGAIGNMVGLYSNVSGRVAGSATWAMNGLCNVPIVTALRVGCDGIEIDINNSAAGGIGYAFGATGASASSGSYTAFAVQWLDQQNYPTNSNPVKWAVGFYEQDGSVLYAAQFAAQQTGGANVNGAPILYDYYDGAAHPQTYQEFASSLGMQHQCSGGGCMWNFQGAVGLFAGAAYQIYLSAAGSVAYLAPDGGITAINVGNNVAPINLNGLVTSGQVKVTGLLNLAYAGVGTCTATGSIAVQVNGVMHAIPYC